MDGKVFGSVWYMCKVCKVCLEDLERMLHHINTKHGPETNDPNVKKEEEFIEKNPLTGQAIVKEEASVPQPQNKNLSKDIFNQEQKPGEKRQKNQNSSRFTCNVCYRNFYQEAHLTVHMRKHTGEKPYGCVLCQKSFAQQTILDNHIRSHTGERPFKCRYCEKRFAQVTSVTSHERLHTGEMPYQCEFCKKKFTQLANWQSHVKKIHNQNTKNIKQSASPNK